MICSWGTASSKQRDTINGNFYVDQLSRGGDVKDTVLFLDLWSHARLDYICEGGHYW